jgi:hypothetical protein
MWSSRWNENCQGKPKYSEKICPSATVSTTNPTWPDVSSNPGRRGGKLSYNATFGAYVRMLDFLCKAVHYTGTFGIINWNGAAQMMTFAVSKISCCSNASCEVAWYETASHYANTWSYVIRVQAAERRSVPYVLLALSLSCLSACKAGHVDLFAHCRATEVRRPTCDMRFPHSSMKQISQEFRCIETGKEENNKCKLKRRWSNEAIANNNRPQSRFAFHWNRTWGKKLKMLHSTTSVHLYHRF